MELYAQSITVTAAYCQTRSTDCSKRLSAEYSPFRKQTLYSHGIQSNLLPRTMIGIGFTWNLFDGLDRGERVRLNQMSDPEQTLALGQMKARDDLAVGVDKLYTQLEKAQDNVKSFKCSDCLMRRTGKNRIRKKSFTEGMATTEVIDAETMLASVRVARLAAYYEYDVALNLLSLCGTPEQFANYQPKP